LDKEVNARTRQIKFYNCRKSFSFAKDLHEFDQRNIQNGKPYIECGIGGINVKTTNDMPLFTPLPSIACAWFHSISTLLS
jgi:hypothetical protein